MGIMDYVQRFQALQVHRVNSDELIKVGSAQAATPAHQPLLLSPGYVRDIDRIC